MQANIGGGGADGFSNTMSGRNIFRTRRMRDGHRGARNRPGLLHAIGGESKGRDEVLRGKRDSVGAIAIIRRVDNEGDVICQHFVDIKDNTRISVTTERVPSNDRKGSGVGDGRTLTAEEVELDDLRLGRIPSRRMTCLACAGQK